MIKLSFSPQRAYRPPASFSCPWFFLVKENTLSDYLILLQRAWYPMSSLGMIAVKLALWGRPDRTKVGASPSGWALLGVEGWGLPGFSQITPWGPHLGVVTEAKCGPRLTPKTEFLVSGAHDPQRKKKEKCGKGIS